MTLNTMRYLGTLSTGALLFFSHYSFAIEYNSKFSDGFSEEDHDRISERSSLRSEVIGVSPQVGAVNFTDPAGRYTSRITYGIGFDYNAASAIGPELGDESRDIYAGVQSGFYFSHLGSTGSDFLGTSPNGNLRTSMAANILIIPLDLKFGYMVGEEIRLSGHAGGNLNYRSVSRSLNLGSVPSQTDDGAWSIYPNIGGDLEIGVTPEIAIIARPDLTITPGNDLFMGTLGVVAQVL